MIKNEKRKHTPLKFLLAQNHYEKSRKGRGWFFIERPHQHTKHFTVSNAKSLRSSISAAYWNWEPNKTPEELILEFAAEKNDAGLLLHPHFNEVRFDMGQLIADGKAKTLKDAYAKAIEARLGQFLSNT